VFNNATLDDLIARRPVDENALLDVTGIGPVKVERYGAAILEIIAANEPD
jgi:superfamily II DNA helicase RecQ